MHVNMCKDLQADLQLLLEDYLTQQHNGWDRPMAYVQAVPWPGSF